MSTNIKQLVNTDYIDKYYTLCYYIYRLVRY